MPSLPIPVFSVPWWLPINFACKAAQVTVLLLVPVLLTTEQIRVLGGRLEQLVHGMKRAYGPGYRPDYQQMQEDADELVLILSKLPFYFPYIHDGNGTCFRIFLELAIFDCAFTAPLDLWIDLISPYDLSRHLSRLGLPPMWNNWDETHACEHASDPLVRPQLIGYVLTYAITPFPSASLSWFMLTRTPSTPRPHATRCKATDCGCNCTGRE